METTPIAEIIKTASSFEIKLNEVLSSCIKVDINLQNKEFSIACTSVDQSSGIKFEVGGCKDIALLKSIIDSYSKAVEVIELEFNNNQPAEEPVTEENTQP